MRDGPTRVSADFPANIGGCSDAKAYLDVVARRRQQIIDMNFGEFIDVDAFPGPL